MEEGFFRDFREGTERSLLGFRIGRIKTSFQMEGMVLGVEGQESILGAGCWVACL